MTIAELREAKNMTQKELADAMGVEQSSVSRWESSERKPGKKTLIKMANVLGCAPEDIELASRAATRKTAGELVGLIPLDWWDKYSTVHVSETIDILKKAYNAGYEDGKRTP